MSKTITLDNREKYNKIFSDTVNICLETLSKDHCYHVSRLGCGELISPLVARLSIKLSGYLKEIINEIEMESCDQPVIKIDENESVEFNDVNYLRRQLNPLLNVTMKKYQAQQNIEASTNENITHVHQDSDNCVDNNKAGGQSKSSTIKINSVKAIKNKDLVSIELIKKKTCPKAIPLKNIWQSSNKINVDKDDDNKVLKRVSGISSSNAVEHTPLHQQSSSKCTSGQSEMTKIVVSNLCYMCNSNDDNEMNKKRNNSMTKNHGQSDNEFKKFRPNDNDDSTVKINDSKKNKLKEAAIHNSNLKYKKLLKAKKKLTINGDKLSKYLIQKKKNIDKINNWVYARCVEYKKKNLRITDDRLNQLSLKAVDKFLPDGDRFRLPIWREQFYKKYNITGKPSDRTMRYFCK